MRKIIYLFFVFTLPFSITVHGRNSDKADLITKANQFISQQNHLGFQENIGQVSDLDNKAASYVLFKAETPDLRIWITTTGLSYQFLKMEKAVSEIKRGNKKKDFNNIKIGEWCRVDMVLKGAHIQPQRIIKENEIFLGRINNYFAHCPQGVFNQKTFSKITISEVYPGIDWVLFADNGKLEYDFIVHPHADPGLIKLVYEGSGNFSAENNQIFFKNKLGEITEGKLLCYQSVKSKIIPSTYILKKNIAPVYLGAGNNVNSNLDKNLINENVFSYEVSIETGKYNSNEILIIDPQLVWGTYFGGNSGAHSNGIDCDDLGNVYIGGQVFGSGFPNQNWAGAYNQPLFGGATDAFIISFTNSGVLRWATFYGGTDNEWVNSIACDKESNVYVTGYAGLGQGNFPLTNRPGAFNQSTPSVIGLDNSFIARFSGTTGACSWSSYCMNGEAHSIACDGNNNIYVTGFAVGNVNPFQEWPGAFNDSIDGGLEDIFLMRFDNNGVLNWSTNYGGAGNETGIDISFDSDNNIYVTGIAHDSFPTFNKPGAFYDSVYVGNYGNGFILRFNNTGALTWATLYPGTESFTNIKCDADNHVFVTGYTAIDDNGPFPTQNWAGAYNQPVYGGGLYDAVILRFDSAGIVTWATHYGGLDQELSGNMSTGAEMDIDECGNVYISLASLDMSTLYTYHSCSQFFPGTIDPWSNVLIKFNNMGKVIWAAPVGEQDGAGWGFVMALDNSGNLFVTKTDEVLSPWPLVNPGSGAYYDTIPFANEELYIAKFTPDDAPTFSQYMNNDTASISMLCGDAPYNYVWSNGNQTLNTDSSTNTLSGLAAGTYDVTVTSNCNQTVTATFVITGREKFGNLESQISIYPNPANGQFNVDLKTAYQNTSVEIYNSIGALVYKQIIARGKNAIKLSDEANGLYLIKVISDTKIIATGKIVKQ